MTIASVPIDTWHEWLIVYVALAVTFGMAQAWLLVTFNIVFTITDFVIAVVAWPVATAVLMAAMVMEAGHRALKWLVRRLG